MAMSASMNWIPWKAPIGCSNARRSRAYPRAASRAAWAMPTAWAPMVGRDCSRVRMAMANPSPSSPRRLSTGTSQSAKWSATVGLPRIPIFRSCLPTLNPGMPGSTRSAVTPRARRARSVERTR